MVMQPKRTQVHTGSNLVAFDSAGATLYGLNTETSEFGLRRIQVLADGLAQQLVVSAATSYGTRALSFANDRVVADAFNDEGVIVGNSAGRGVLIVEVLQEIASGNLVEIMRLDEAIDRVECARLVGRRADGCGRLDGEPACEDSQPAKHAPFLLPE